MTYTAATANTIDRVISEMTDTYGWDAECAEDTAADAFGAATRAIVHHYGDHTAAAAAVLRSAFVALNANRRAHRRWAGELVAAAAAAR
jgi:hypothetical protein